MTNLLGFFHDIEKTLHIKSDKQFNNMVCPAETYSIPIHNWYRFKEGYSPNLLKTLLKHFRISKPLRILDPFLGSGTTLLSAGLDPSINVEYGTGYEVNPFISFMSKTKLNAFKLDISLAETFLHEISVRNFDKDIPETKIPPLSTIKKAFSPLTLARLINLKDFIKITFENNCYEHDFFMLTYASILEDVSIMKKSGRALKISKSIQDYDIKQIFSEKATQMISDVRELKKHKLEKLTVINEDVRKLSSSEKKYNIVLFSPPYLNHFDYTEVYKLELWMLDFVNNHDDFRALRHKTMRSHSSLKFQKTNIYSKYTSTIIADLIKSIESSNNQQHFYTTIQGYIDDMYQLFNALEKNTSDDVIIICVVANSLFGSAKQNNLTPVATDLLISEIARDIGFKNIELKVARRVNRRGVSFPFGRESLIIFRKENLHIAENSIISVNPI